MHPLHSHRSLRNPQHSLRNVAWWSCLWPGLPQLWYCGHWTGLTLAVGFSLLLNVTLLGSFVWTDVASRELQVSAWILLGTAWGFWVMSAWRWRRAAQRDAQNEPDDLFPAAIGEYLKGNWFEAEGLLDRLIQSDPQDIDARLMLATLWRHTGRRNEARLALKHLQRVEGSGKWMPEIQNELERLAEAEPTAEPMLVLASPAQARAA